MDTPMKALMERMAKSKGHPGFVVFVKHRSMPIAQPMRGPAASSRAEATKQAEEMLNNPVYTTAWTVGRDGIIEVTR